MASRFYPITRDEVHDFLTALGFQPLSLKGVVELAYGKIVHVGQHRLSLRIYTAINPSGESRERGSDAIRVQLYHKVETGDGEGIVPVGKSQKCLRVESWQANLRKAIERHAHPENYRLCPACGHPMVQRENRTTGEQFWACSMYRVTRCKGRNGGARHD